MNAFNFAWTYTI